MVRRGSAAVQSRATLAGYYAAMRTRLFALVAVAVTAVTLATASEAAPAPPAAHRTRRSVRSSTGRSSSPIAAPAASGPSTRWRAYELAIEQGADFIEPDLVITKDGALVVRHENEIGGTTDVAAIRSSPRAAPPTPSTACPVTGWFTEDFTLAELKTLRARERLPAIRPVATVRRPSDLAGLVMGPVLHQSFGVALPAGSPLTRRRRLRLAELGDTPLALAPRAGAPGFHDEVIAACAARGWSPATVHHPAAPRTAGPGPRGHRRGPGGRTGHRPVAGAGLADAGGRPAGRSGGAGVARERGAAPAVPRPPSRPRWPAPCATHAGMAPGASGPVGGEPPVVHVRPASGVLT